MCNFLNPVKPNILNNVFKVFKMEQFIEPLDSIYSLELLLEKEKASCLIQKPKLSKDMQFDAVADIYRAKY